MIENKIVVGISQGDINGIGLEIILKTLIEPELSEICIPVLFSSQKTVSYFRKVLNLDEFNFNPLRDFNQINTKKPNVFICYEEEVVIELGKPSVDSGKYAKIALEQATQALIDKNIDVLVTAPINKHTMQEAGFNYPGHTEYLGEKLGGKPLMLLCANDLKVAVVTGHLALKDVPQHITTENVYSKIEQLHSSLIKDFGIRKPKIAVLGLNPHAGENGKMGNEEELAIIPAIKKAQENPGSTTHSLIYLKTGRSTFVVNRVKCIICTIGNCFIRNINSILAGLRYFRYPFCRTGLTLADGIHLTISTFGKRIFCS